ncbi:MAG: hypothetical protein J0J01_13000 [Reyranella sp.]|uniref:hypothetical protein n=1 Tax=Reyranella sp. TaxID=1929291 RepID=UPI001AC364E6|nr:hypothetical protein [Reyranella sp.]MBN9087821.1 hypothetical protein [Reyranella sp.]
MLRILIDGNRNEGPWTVVIPHKWLNPNELIEGRRVVVYEGDQEWIAVLRRGEVWPWVADIEAEIRKPAPESPTS